MKELLKEFKNMEGISIVKMAENKNGSWKDYEYFTLEKDGYFFYIENSICSWEGITITAYKKIDYNHKIQIDYPRTIKNIQDALDYIEKTITRKKEEPLKGVFKQSINGEFLKTQKQNEKEYKTIFERLSLGYREKEILKNINHIEHLQNDGVYNVFAIYDNNNNCFQIEVNSNRVVG